MEEGDKGYDARVENNMKKKKYHIRIKDAYVKPIKMGRRRHRHCTTVNRSHVEERYDER